MSTNVNRGFNKHQVIPQPRSADPPRYLFIDGHPYMLASHAAEQMQRVIVLTRAKMLDVICDEHGMVALVDMEQEPA